MGIQVGVSKIDITPPIGVKMAGFAARLKDSEGIHDPLFVRTIVIKCQKNLVSISSIDVSTLDKIIVDKIREFVSRYVNIPKENILITATHTHSGPHTGKCGEDWTDLEWLGQLVKKVATSIIIAYKKLKVAKVGFGIGYVDNISANRREPGGPIDPYVRVIAFNDLKGDPIATLVNYSMHPVTLRYNNTLISADYPGYLCKYLDEWGYGMGIFLQGTAGDIRPKIVEKLGTEYDIEIGYKEAERMGKILAAEAIKTRESIEKFLTNVCVLTKRIEYELPTQKLPPLSEVESRIKGAEEKLRKAKSKEEAIKANWENYANRLLKFMLKNRVKNNKIKTESMLIRINDVLIISLPGEPLVRIGMEIRERIGKKDAVIVGYSNDSIGYIPSLHDFEKGGYECTVPWCIINKEAIKKIIELVSKEATSLLAPQVPP